MSSESPSPPRLALLILRWSTASCGSEAVVGDLVERFNHRITRGIGTPRLWFWAQTLLFAGYFLAERSTILRANLGEGLILVLFGVPLGLLGAWALSRFLETMLFGVTPTDPLTYGAISALLLLVGLAASYTPAHRAARVDPVVALRVD